MGWWQEGQCYFGVFSIIIFYFRMKRSASSCKQNLVKSYLSKNPSKQKLPYETIKLLSSQTLSPELHNQQIHTSKTPLSDFYKTFGHNNFTEFSRPESKQAFRKCMGRPQTSKGVRPLQRSSKGWGGDHKIGCYSQYVLDKRELQQSVETQPSSGANIEIIVTKSNKRRGERKMRSKFETDLDDQFLQLFAN